MADTVQPDTTQTAQTVNPPPDNSAPQQTPLQQSGASVDTQTPQVAADVPGGDQQPQSSPAVLIPEKRGGLGGIVDEIRNALSPQQATQVYRDPETGARYVQRPYKTRGQQWAQIASEAVSGAAHGLQAGRGAGHMGDAAVAGLEAGNAQTAQAKQLQEKQADEDYAVDRQNRMDKANAYLQQVQFASQEFALKRMQVKAGQDDETFAQGQEQHERDLNSVDLGTYGDHVTLADVKKVHPGFWKDAVNGDVRSIPVYDANGNRQGVHLYLRQAGVGEQPAPPGTTAYRFVAGKTPNEAPHIEQFTPTGTHTIRDIDTYNAAAYTQLQKWQSAQAETASKVAEAKKNTAEASLVPSEIRKNEAEATKATAEAEEQGNNGALVDLIGTGQVAVGRMGYLLARKPELLAQVVAKYPDFDSSKVDSYAGTYADFTHGKTSVALNAGGTALEHLQELRDLNTVQSHVPGTPAWTAYHNKANTVSAELARFYGTDNIPGVASIKDSLNSNLPGSRDAAIRTQARSMGDKLDSFKQTWDNAAPSAAYQAKMPNISREAQIARANLDPTYAQKIAQPGAAAPARAAAPQAAPPRAAAPQPQAQTSFQYMTADGKQGWDGQKWVPIAAPAAH
jgi:hypothetical protein